MSNIQHATAKNLKLNIPFLNKVETFFFTIYVRTTYTLIVTNVYVENFELKIVI